MEKLTTDATILIVPGLRDHVPTHWQTLLAERLDKVHTVEPLTTDKLSCQARVQALDAAVRAIDGPIVLVAHSGGCIMVAHWALVSRRPIRAALLAAPPDFEQPLPAGYPTLANLRDNGWLPVPRQPLPFRSIVAASNNDPLATLPAVEYLAADWGAEVVNIGAVGHLNPASGFGEWPQALDFIRQLDTPPA